MTQLSYGIEKPEDLLNKLVLDGNKLGDEPHPHDIFNFIVTAAVLNEWVRKYYSSHKIILALAAAQELKDFERIPPECTEWITDKTCIPNKGGDIRRDVYSALSICWDTSRASKHFHWPSSKVTAIEKEPVVKGYYQWFFTAVEPGLYIEYDGVYYTLSQLEGILIQFYSGLIAHVEKSN